MFALLMSFLACGPKHAGAGPQAMGLAPSTNVHLRNSFDTDPSLYLGRFVKDSAQGAFDESSTMSLACSEFVSFRRIDGGGVRYNELLEISSSASARLGLPLIANAAGTTSNDGIVRVSYELTGKMIGEIKDPAGFADCCKTSPDQCTSRYIGEFIEGRGAIYHQAEKKAAAQAGATDLSSGAGGDVAFSHGTAWERGVEFPNPVFFAFKISETPYSHRSPSACNEFMTTLPPSDDDGVYILGSTPKAAKDEATARRRAMNDATISAYQAFGIAPDFDSPVSAEIQAKEWCIDAQGDRYSAKVLAYAKRPANPPPVVVAPPNTDVAAATTTNTGPAPVAAPPSTSILAATTPVAGPTPVITPPNPSPSVTAAPVTVAGPAAAPPKADAGPIEAETLAQLRSSISAAFFSDDKLALVRTVAARNTFTVAQVSSLMTSFAFDNDRVAAITILRPSITDPQNGFVLSNNVTFSKDKKAVMALFE